jgi:hypothetical protein
MITLRNGGSTTSVGVNSTSKEPTIEDVTSRMKLTGENYYNARERLREEAYGGKPPDGYSSWGDYWKSL